MPAELGGFERLFFDAFIKHFRKIFILIILFSEVFIFTFTKNLMS